MSIYIQLLFSIYIGFARIFQDDNPPIRTFTIDGKEVKVTFSADRRYYGKYSGAKTGYLLLREDGTGEYQYDYFGLATATCKPGPVPFRWGFILDENNNIVKFERDYGYSIPIIYVCTGESSFQGCRKNVFIDYLLDLRDGTIEVSSSDDWKKGP